MKKLKSWIKVPDNSDFSIYNIPFGIYSNGTGHHAIATAIGDCILDLDILHANRYFHDLNLPVDIFKSQYLNPFIELGKPTTQAIRLRVQELLVEGSDLEFDAETIKKALLKQDLVTMLLPLQIGDYTDFYSSIEHATNVGSMFRDPDNALLPNWLHIPVAYHGRSSSIIPSGIPVHRPQGQSLPNGATEPVFGPSQLVDFELEMAFITTVANDLGEPIPVNEAEEYIFGLVLLNDWSARDIQKWEYVPLGPFLAKNFASSISPWIVTLDALEPYRVESPKPIKPQLPYLQYKGKKSYDINLEVAIQPQGAKETVVCKSNFKYMYWNMSQQLAHHTVNGCPINSGDLMGSGTISGPTPDSYGSMLELTWRGEKPLMMKDGTERKFINDNDTVIMRGFCEKDGTRIGFGEVSTKLLPIYKRKK